MENTTSKIKEEKTVGEEQRADMTNKKIVIW